MGGEDGAPRRAHPPAGVVTAPPALRYTSLRALWGAPCPRQGRLLPPTPVAGHSGTFSPACTSADVRQLREEGFHEHGAHRHAREPEEGGEALAEGASR